MPTKSRKSGPSLQELRSGLARIKKAGLADIKSTTKATRTKSNLALFKKYNSVASGSADTVKLSPKMAARYKEAKVPGITIVPAPKGSKKQPTAIVSKRVNYTKTQVSKGQPIFEGMVARVRPLKNGEIETIALPVSHDNIGKFIEQLKDHPEWNNLKMQGNERFTIRFMVEGKPYGLNAPQQYGTMRQLAEHLLHYQSSLAAMQSSRKSQREYLEMLEIVRVVKGQHDLRNTDQREKEKLNKKARRYARLRKQRRG